MTMSIFPISSVVHLTHHAQASEQIYHASASPLLSDLGSFTRKTPPSAGGTSIPLASVSALPLRQPTPSHLHIDSEARDEEQLATASGSGMGLLQMDPETSRYIGRGGGALYVLEEDEPEVSMPGEEVVKFIDS